jgi:hypothetical protein
MTRQKTFTPDRRDVRSKTARQIRQRSAGIPDKPKAITDLQRQEMSQMILWLKGQRAGGYRWIARHTPRGANSFGWHQRVAAGHRDVKPTRADLDAIRRLYDLMQEEHDLDEQVLTLLLDIIEHRGAMDYSLSRLITLMRIKGKK